MTANELAEFRERNNRYKRTYNNTPRGKEINKKCCDRYRMRHRAELKAKRSVQYAQEKERSIDNIMRIYMESPDYEHAVDGVMRCQ